MWGVICLAQQGLNLCRYFQKKRAIKAKFFKSPTQGSGFQTLGGADEAQPCQAYPLYNTPSPLQRVPS